MKKRIISLALSFLLAASLLPGAAWAAGEEEIFWKETYPANPHQTESGPAYDRGTCFVFSGSPAE